MQPTCQPMGYGGSMGGFNSSYAHLTQRYSVLSLLDATNVNNIDSTNNHFTGTPKQ